MRGGWFGYGWNAVALLALVVAAPSARAASWTITPSIAGEQAYSDNVGLGAGSGIADFSTAVTPGLRVEADGNRLDLSFDYKITRVTFWQNPNLDEFRHNLSARADVEIIPDFLFLGAESAIREEFIDNTGAISAGGANSTSNRSTVQTHNFNPSVRHRFGSFADLGLSYLLSTTLVQAGADDSTTHTANLGLASGAQFRTFQWQLDLTGSMRASTGNSTGGGAAGNVSDDRLTATLNLTYPVSPRFALLGSVGYEEISDNQVAKDPIGAIWNAGFRWSPSDRTDVSATYGRRFDDDNVNVSIAYAITSSLNFSASFSQTLQASDQRRSGLLLPPGAIDADGDFIDDVTGLPIDLGDGGFSFQNNSTRNDTFSSALSGRSGRTTYSLSSNASQRASDVTDTKQVVTGLTLSVGRAFGRRTTGEVNVSYRNTDFDTADRITAKLLELRARLLNRASPAAVIALSAPYEDQPSEAEDMLRAFMAAMPPLEPWLRTITVPGP